MRERLAKFKLELHPDKTRLIRFGRYAAQQCKKRHLGKPETFDFLGFAHCCGRRRGGVFKIVRLTIKKRMRVTLKSIRAQLMRRRHEFVPKLGRWLGRVVQGYFNYYAVSGNLYRLGGFRSEVCCAWRHALMRRSQRHRMSWCRFACLIGMYLPTVKLIPLTHQGGFASLLLARAVCSSAASTDLCGGRRVTIVPTATAARTAGISEGQCSREGRAPVSYGEKSLPAPQDPLSRLGEKIRRRCSVCWLANLLLAKRYLMPVNGINPY